jgi:alpha-glucoside transport system substrate-binding protein
MTAPASTPAPADTPPPAPAGPIRARARDLLALLRRLGGGLRGGAGPSGGGEPDTAPPSATLGELTRRRLVLLVLTVLTTAVLYPAFQGVHSHAGPLRTSGAPGVLAVDTAMEALARAQDDVEQSLDTTSGFHTSVSVANQSLARAAAADVTGLKGRQTLQTVTGLITTYTGWIEDASAQPAGSALRDAYLSYARGMLGRETGASAADATVMGRLRELQAEQQQAVQRQTDFGTRLWTLWGLSAVLAGLLLWRLAEAFRYSARRFRRRWNVSLAAAVVLLAGGWAVLAVFTFSTHSAMAAARRDLAPPLSDGRISEAGAAVSGRLAGTGLHAAAAGWIVAGGLVLAVLVVLGLQRRINEYRVKARVIRLPSPLSTALGMCLAVLAAVGVVAVRGSGAGSVTLLANWTGQEQRDFQSQILDAFEQETGIHVVYQGSSAESQVLAADVESGTPPDIAVLPGPGELAGYAHEGLLTPLDDVAGPAGFPATWVPRVAGPGGDRHTYWVPVKADLKSLVWHPSSLGADQVRADAAEPASWCLGMAADATSGWPGSDWIEDILLQQSGQGPYEDWAAGKLRWDSPKVRRAWTTWGAMVGAGGSPHVARALVTSYRDEAAGVAEVPPTCELEHQSTFVRTLTAWRTVGADFTPSADLIPGADRSAPARWEVSGDLAAVLHDTSQAHELLSYLASAEAQGTWADIRSGFSVRRDVLAAGPGGPGGAGSTDGRIAAALRDRRAVRCYDASDAMPAQVRDAFALAVLRYLADPSSLDAQLKTLDKVTGLTEPTPLTGICSR